MDSQLKQRLVGAVTLVVLGVIFIPMVLDGPPPGREGSAGASRPDHGHADWRASPAPTRVVVPLEVPRPRGPLAEPERPVPDPEPVAGPARGERGAPAGEAAPEEPPATAMARAERVQPQPDPSTRTPTPAEEDVDAQSAAPMPPASSPESGGPAEQAYWSLQVASFRDRDGAAKVHAQLENAGYPGFVREAEINGRTWHQVLVGPGLTRARAEALREEVFLALKERRLVTAPGMLVRHP